MLNTFEKFLQDYNYNSQGSVNDAVIYATADGGKRVRPMLLLALLSDYGINIEKGLSAALAIELIHSYSLVHDDLPAMDNDDYRRGKLSTHKQFGEDIAILAGDALLTEAFAIIANDIANYPEEKIKLVQALAKYSGIGGMIYGQQLDLAGESKALLLDDVKEINVYKTSNLIMFALSAAAIIANADQDIEKLLVIAKDLGLAFQIQDDILDVTKTFEEIGKYASDEDNDKSTYVKLIGLEASKASVAELFENIYNLLNTLDLKSNNLKELIVNIENRQK